ncbi:unnamed protein product [Caenorhabditis bovis]|uniref:Uncharacterized protein n=1 Tax=Caenorhabditis bovis TaxID=2654633 RepID=A0A8S1EC56_9PELO|nr:unnamed protein product [Caenorhabditis bovis]
MPRIGVFTLDTTNPRFYTLNGRIHVKLALLIIIIIFVFLEISEWSTYIFVDEVGEKIEWSEALMAVFQLIMVACMILGFVHENQHCLIPFIVFMFLTVTTMGIWICHCIFFAFFPYAKNAEKFFGFKQSTTLLTREKNILLLLAVIVAFTTLFSWWLQVGLVCYQYFESRTNEKRVEMSTLATNRPSLGSSTPAETTKNQSNEEQQNSNGAISFPNQNFSISDDEDDVKVFEKKSGPDIV